MNLREASGSLFWKLFFSKIHQFWLGFVKGMEPKLEIPTTDEKIKKI